MSKRKKFKNISGDIVFSTNQNFEYDYGNDEDETLLPEEQDLRVWLDKKHRGGKIASLVKGFVGSEDVLKELAKILKSKCGVGGSAKDGEIIIQGDHREKIIKILQDHGYKAKKAGG